MPRSGAKDLKRSSAYPKKYGKAVAKHHRAYVEPWLQHLQQYWNFWVVRGWDVVKVIGL